MTDDHAAYVAVLDDHGHFLRGAFVRAGEAVVEDNVVVAVKGPDESLAEFLRRAMRASGRAL